MTEVTKENFDETIVTTLLLFLGYNNLDLQLTDNKIKFLFHNYVLRMRII